MGSLGCSPRVHYLIHTCIHTYKAWVVPLDSTTLYTHTYIHTRPGWFPLIPLDGNQGFLLCFSAQISLYVCMYVEGENQNIPIIILHHTYTHAQKSWKPCVSGFLLCLLIVHKYPCMYVCVHVCMYTCMLCIHVCMYVYMYACMYV